MPKSRKQAYLALLITSVIWGFAPPIIKNTLSYISPLDFLYYRFLIVSIILFIPLVLKLKKTRPSLKQIFKYAGLGVIGTPLTLILLFSGISLTSASESAVISIISPILVILGGAVWLKENVTGKEKIGIAIALIGTLMTVLGPFSGFHFRGNLLVLGGALTWALFTLLAKKSKGLDPLIMTASGFFAGLIMLTPLSLHASVPTQAFFGIAYMSILGSAVAYFTYIYGLSKIEASEATVFTYLQPLFAIPAAAIFLNEKPAFLFFVGALIISLGVFVCESGKSA